MKKALFVLAMLALTGCNPSTPGGSGSGTARDKPITGAADDTFTINVPNTSVKQGETKSVKVTISRGKNFGHDVTVKFSDPPKGVSFDPSSPTLKASDKETSFSVKATDEGALGDHTIMTSRVLPLFLAVLALFVLAGAPALAEKDKDDTHAGLVVKAGDGKLTMTDKAGKNEHTHDVAKDAKITCDGKECKLEELQKGVSITVTTGKQGDKKVATRIEAKKAG